MASRGLAESDDARHHPLDRRDRRPLACGRTSAGVSGFCPQSGRFWHLFAGSAAAGPAARLPLRPLLLVLQAAGLLSLLCLRLLGPAARHALPLPLRLSGSALSVCPVLGIRLVGVRTTALPLSAGCVGRGFSKRFVRHPPLRALVERSQARQRRK